MEICRGGGAREQRRPPAGHRRRHPPQRIERRDLVAIAEGRPRPVLEWQTIKPQRDRHAAHEGGIILADQDHALGPPARHCCRHTRQKRVSSTLRRFESITTALEYRITRWSLSSGSPKARPGGR